MKALELVLPSTQDRVAMQVTERRLQRMREVAAKRTRFVTLLLDDVHDPHNLAAVLRSADAFGIADVHAIEQTSRIRISRHVARGAERWVHLYRYASAKVAIEALRQQGYQIWVAAGEARAARLQDWPGTQPTVFVFGNEHSGVCPQLRALADQCFAVPMVGMVESLNISVACAVTLASVRVKLEASNQNFVLAAGEQQALLQYWLTHHQVAE